MSYKKCIYFLLTFVIIGLLYTNFNLAINVQTRSLIGYVLLGAFLVGSVFLLYRPISSNASLKKHFLTRLLLLLLCAFVCCLPYLDTGTTDNTGTGYLWFLAITGVAFLYFIFMTVETIILARRKKYDRVLCNFFLAEAIYCFLVFSNLFGF